MSVRVSSEENSIQYLPVVYSNMRKLGLKIALASHYLAKKIIQVALRVFNSQCLFKSKEVLEIRIAHIKLILAQQRLPMELRKYLVAVTRNLPSLRGYLRGNINQKCKDCYEKFKEIMFRDIQIKVHPSLEESMDDYHNKIVQKIDNDIKKLGEKVIGAPKTLCLEGVCHAMISQVAKQFLDNDVETVSFSKYATECAKGVDEEIAGLQLFLDSTSGYEWDQLAAVNSLLGLTSSLIKSSQLDISGNGLFHLAIPVDYDKHSLLLKINPKTCQLLDPNFGFFEVPNSELKNLLKAHYAFYYREQCGTNPTIEVINSIFAQDKARIFSVDKGIEIRQVEKAKAHNWQIRSNVRGHHQAIWGPPRLTRAEEYEKKYKEDTLLVPA